MYESFDWANLPTATTTTNAADELPALIIDSSDEEPYQKGENCSECSSADSGSIFRIPTRAL